MAMMKFFISMFLFVLTPSVLASDWFYLLAETNDRAIFFDLESAEKNKDNLTMWVRHIALSESRLIGTGIFSYTNKVEYDCKKRITIILASYAYNKNRELIGQVGRLKDQEVVPGTVGEFLFKVACFTGFPNALPQNSAMRLGTTDTYEFAEELANVRSQRGR